MKCYATIHGVIAEKSIFFEQDIVSANNVNIYSLYDLFQKSTIINFLGNVTGQITVSKKFLLMMNLMNKKHYI